MHTNKLTKPATALAVCLLALGATVPSAQSAEVIYNGVVASACVLQLGSVGVLTPNGNNTVLSSKDGGTPGTVAVLATGVGFEVSATKPTGFLVAPPTGNDATTFETSYGLSGATAVQQVIDGTGTGVNLGSSTMEVDLTATKTSGVFAAGAYQAVVTVTCE